MIAKEAALSHDALVATLAYDPATGLFHFRKRGGSPAGSMNELGHIVIGVRGNYYYAHRLAWFYMTREWPRSVRHKNTIKHDNRWDNLTATVGEVRTPRIGLRGAYRSKGANTFHSLIRVDGRQRYLGAFKTEEAAHQAYCKAAARRDAAVVGQSEVSALAEAFKPEQTH